MHEKANASLYEHVDSHLHSVNICSIWLHYLYLVNSVDVHNNVNPVDVDNYVSPFDIHNNVNPVNVHNNNVVSCRCACIIKISI